MRVIRIHEPGGPEAMTLADTSPGAPGEGEARVRVEAAGVNFIDIYQRAGAYSAPLPLDLGLEGAGTVEEVGPGVALRAGDRVAWAGVQGSYATHVRAPADKLVAVPSGVDSRTAAAAMLQGMTAHYLTRSTFPLRAGHTCLIHAAAGGVGGLLCQLGHRAGARVIATAGSAEKGERARRAGATDVILYREVDFAAEVARKTDGRGVDVVYDSVGASTFDRGLDCLARRGMMVLYGQSSGPVAPVDPQRLAAAGSAFLTRPSLFHYIEERADLEERAGEILDLIATGHLAIAIARELPLAGAADAHALLEARETAGKLLLRPDIEG